MVSWMKMITLRIFSLGCCCCNHEVYQSGLSGCIVLVSSRRVSRESFLANVLFFFIA